MSNLTREQLRLFRDQGRDGRLFRAGMIAEAQSRNSDTALHHEMLDYLRVMCEMHPDWSDQLILESALRVFADGAHALTEAALIELEAKPVGGDGLSE